MSRASIESERPPQLTVGASSISMALGAELFNDGANVS